MTVEQILETALYDSRKFYDWNILKGEVYVVSILEDEVRIQAVYSGELVRELPDELIQSSQVSLATGYTEMSVKFGESVFAYSNYKLTITLT